MSICNNNCGDFRVYDDCCNPPIAQHIEIYRGRETFADPSFIPLGFPVATLTNWNGKLGAAANFSLAKDASILLNAQISEPTAADLSLLPNAELKAEGLIVPFPDSDPTTLSPILFLASDLNKSTASVYCDISGAPLAVLFDAEVRRSKTLL